MHTALPWHERMVIIAEYIQKNAKFGGLDPKGPRKAARALIANTNGAALTETEYKLYLGLLRSQVERRLA